MQMNLHHGYVITVLDGVNKIQVKDDIEAEADLDESIENPEYTPRL